MKYLLGGVFAFSMTLSLALSGANSWLLLGFGLVMLFAYFLISSIDGSGGG